MKLQQLEYLSAVVRSDLNVSAAARRLHTSQPALSKQIRQLEEELGTRIFLRQARQFTGLTAAGQQIVRHALSILREARYIEGMAAELRHDDSGELSIGTTHTQARYVLPHILRQFSEAYPRIRLHLHQGTAEQIAEMVRADVVDLAMATGSRDLFPKWVLLPCYQWHRCLIVPRGHRLAGVETVTLRDLANHPLITYAFSFSGPSALQSTFADAGLKPQIALTAWDADVIKTYVRQGLGVGMIAEMALDSSEDADLVRLEIAHLFQPHQTWIGFPRHALLRQYAYRLLSLIAAHLDQATVQKAESCADQLGVDALFAKLVLPGPGSFRSSEPVNHSGSAPHEADLLSVNAKADVTAALT